MGEIGKKWEDKEPVRWMIQWTEEDEHSYFLRALKEAKKQSKPLAWRKGGRKELGIRGLQPEEKKGEKYVVHGLPVSWGPARVEGLLKERGFTEVHQLWPPWYKTQGWIFLDKPGHTEQVWEINGKPARARPYYRGVRKTQDREEGTRITTPKWHRAYADEEKEETWKKQRQEEMKNKEKTAREEYERQQK